MRLKTLSHIKTIAAFASILFCTAAFMGIAVPLLPKAQLIPALLAGNVVVLGFLFLVTLFIGRIYCSLICPLGIYQDGVHFLARKLWKKKKGTYKAEHAKLRYGFLLLAAASLLLGSTSLFLLLDPYSIYGRLASDLWLTPWRTARGLLSVGSTIALAGALLYWVIISAFAIKGGRLYCNTICPAGTLLGSISRFALYQPRFNEEKCISCGLCERLCPSNCIDVKNKTVDTSRCVDCLQCVSHCPKRAITFARKGVKNVQPAESVPQGSAISRRQFLAGTAIAAGSAAVALAKGPMALKPVLAQSTKPFILPPGALSQTHLSQNCTACHLCISRCPGHVLRPFTWTQGLDRMGQPYMDHSLGHCLYDCHACSEACPTGAIRPITLEEKRHTQIGVASVDRSKCLVDIRGAHCGRCAMKCPARAIDLVTGKDKRVRPQVNFEKCLGCGACHAVCPADPKAINVYPVDQQVDLRKLAW